MAAPDRPLRADAQRNRDRLVAVARDAFTAADSSVPLEEIARQAGVGIGTLYRHFPTREALVEAVYSAELESFTTGAPALLAALPADLALRAWMDRYWQFAAMKRGMFDNLKAGWAAGRIATPATPATRHRITAAIAEFLTAGAASGILRSDIDPEDVMLLLLGVFMVTARAGTPEQTARLLDLALDALRPHPARIA